MKGRFVNAHTTPFSNIITLSLSHIPEYHSLVQTGKDLPHTRPCVAILLPA
jgi:hypothetical protein